MRRVCTAVLLVLGPLAASGCQACVDDGSQPPPVEQKDPGTLGVRPRLGPNRLQPRLLTLPREAGELRDAGDLDE